jgi:hypothetical protein
MLLAGFEYESKVCVPPVAVVLASLTCNCRAARTAKAQQTCTGDPAAVVNGLLTWCIQRTCCCCSCCQASSWQEATAVTLDCTSLSQTCKLPLLCRLQGPTVSSAAAVHQLPQLLVQQLGMLQDACRLQLDRDCDCGVAPVCVQVMGYIRGYKRVFWQGSTGRGAAVWLVLWTGGMVGPAAAAAVADDRMRSHTIRQLQSANLQYYTCMPACKVVQQPRILLMDGYGCADTTMLCLSFDRSQRHTRGAWQDSYTD